MWQPANYIELGGNGAPEVAFPPVFSSPSRNRVVSRGEKFGVQTSVIGPEYNWCRRCADTRVHPFSNSDVARILEGRISTSNRTLLPSLNCHSTVSRETRTRTTTRCCEGTQS